MDVSKQRVIDGKAVLAYVRSNKEKSRAIQPGSQFVSSRSCLELFGRQSSRRPGTAIRLPSGIVLRSVGRDASGGLPDPFDDPAGGGARAFAAAAEALRAAVERQVSETRVIEIRPWTASDSGQHREG
jgi:hypothetical protein